MEPGMAGAGDAVSACLIILGTGVCGNAGGIDEDVHWRRAGDQSSGAVKRDDENDDGVDVDEGFAAVVTIVVSANNDDFVEVADDIDAWDADVGDDDRGSRTNLDVVVIGDVVLK